MSDWNVEAPRCSHDRCRRSVRLRRQYTETAGTRSTWWPRCIPHRSGSTRQRTYDPRTREDLAAHQGDAIGVARAKSFRSARRVPRRSAQRLGRRCAKTATAKCCSRCGQTRWSRPGGTAAICCGRRTLPAHDRSNKPAAATDSSNASARLRRDGSVEGLLRLRQSCARGILPEDRRTRCMAWTRELVLALEVKMRRQ